MITAVSGDTSFTRRRSSSPLTSGICTSVITRSNASWPSRASASAPVRAVTTAYPSLASMISRNSRRLASSSTIRIRSILKGSYAARSLRAMPAGAGASAAGSLSVNVVPASGRLATAIVPPWDCTIR